MLQLTVQPQGPHAMACLAAVAATAASPVLGLKQTETWAAGSPRHWEVKHLRALPLRNGISLCSFFCIDPSGRRKAADRREGGDDTV